MESVETECQHRRITRGAAVLPRQMNREERGKLGYGEGLQRSAGTQQRSIMRRMSLQRATRRNLKLQKRKGEAPELHSMLAHLEILRIDEQKARKRLALGGRPRRLAGHSPRSMPECITWC